MVDWTTVNQTQTDARNVRRVNIRSIATIGALWPICGKCRHIAQEHNDDKSCGAHVKGQCPCCRTQGQVVKCPCPGYDGPSWEEFKTNYLTPEEIAYYHWEGGK